MIGEREEVLVAIDWIDFEHEGHTCLALHLVNGHGRATPLIWQTVEKATLKGRRSGYEDEVLRRFREVVPEGVRVTVLAANIYLTEVDWAFDTIRRRTAQGPYEAVNYHRFADDVVTTVSAHHTKRGSAERAMQRLQEQLVPLGVKLNAEKTKLVNTLEGEAFGFLGFDLRHVRKRRARRSTRESNCQ